MFSTLWFASHKWNFQHQANIEMQNKRNNPHNMAFLLVYASVLIQLKYICCLHNMEKKLTDNSVNIYGSMTSGLAVTLHHESK